MNMPNPLMSSYNFSLQRFDGLRSLFLNSSIYTGRSQQDVMQSLQSVNLNPATYMAGGAGTLQQPSTDLFVMQQAAMWQNQTIAQPNAYGYGGYPTTSGYPQTYPQTPPLQNNGLQTSVSGGMTPQDLAILKQHVRQAAPGPQNKALRQNTRKMANILSRYMDAAASPANPQSQKKMARLAGKAARLAPELNKPEFQAALSRLGPTWGPAGQQLQSKIQTMMGGINQLAASAPQRPGQTQQPGGGYGMQNPFQLMAMAQGILQFLQQYLPQMGGIR